MDDTNIWTSGVISGSTKCKEKGIKLIEVTDLRWVRKLPLTCPEPSQPGVGQLIPSVFPDFQTN